MYRLVKVDDGATGGDRGEKKGLPMMRSRRVGADTCEGLGARLGTLETSRGRFETPAFMPVATKGAVKVLEADEVKGVGSSVLIANAFHLHLDPGAELIRKMGGLHRFMNWEGTIFTDSGGYQLIRKGFSIKIMEEGFRFKNNEGEEELFSPERCMEVQMALGSDVAMVLDDCPRAGAEHVDAGRSLERTLAWAKRCREAHRRNDQQLFGIVQGGIYPDLRKRCVEELEKMDFDGYGIGGLSIGETREQMFATLDALLPLMPENKVRYLMGVGSPMEMLESISRGIDLFDSVFPTRYGRHGTFFTFSGKFDVRKAVFKDDANPLEKDCGCLACAHYSRAYIRHLFREKEMLAPRLMSIHNLQFTQTLMSLAREAIREKRFSTFKQEIGKVF